MHLLTPHTHNAGYFCNDIETARKTEADVQVCKHCECVILMQKWKDDGGFCGKCMAPICGPCADDMLIYGCVPALKKIEMALNLGDKLKQFNKLAGLDAQPADYQPAIILGVP